MKMKPKYYYRTAGYLILIWLGYIVGQYPNIPTFEFMHFKHIQPNIRVYDKCISITILTAYLALLCSLWHVFWARVSLIFIVWGVIGVVVDEFLGSAEIFTRSEQAALLLSIMTTTMLIWTHHRKRTTK